MKISENDLPQNFNPDAYIKSAEQMIKENNLQIDTIIFSNIEEVNLMRCYIEQLPQLALKFEYLAYNDNKLSDKKKRVIKAINNLIDALHSIEDYTKASEVREIFQYEYDVEKLIYALNPTLTEFDKLLEKFKTNKRDRVPLVTALKNYYLSNIHKQ